MTTAASIKKVGATPGHDETRKSSTAIFPDASAVPTILVATADADIRREMAELLESPSVRTVWAKGVAEVRALLAKHRVAACFCGFWLLDGTYRDVIRHLKNQRTEIPAIVLCAPACPQEFAQYFAAVQIPAINFMCHPYQKSDLERIVPSAFGLQAAPAVGDGLADVA